MKDTSSLLSWPFLIYSTIYLIYIVYQNVTNSKESKEVQIYKDTTVEAVYCGQERGVRIESYILSSDQYTVVKLKRYLS